MLQDTSWAVRRVPQDYLIASYLKDEMPNIEKELELIHEGLDLMKPLSEAFMTHFYACLLNVGTKAASIESSKCKLIKARPDDADAASSSKLLRSRSSIAGGSSPLPTGGDVSLNSNESSKPRGFLDRVIASRSTDEHDQLPQDQSLDEEANVRSPSQRIEDMCKMSIHDHAISAYSKVWTVLGRIDGGTGQLLGQSLRWGLDGVRAWVCAAIIWQHRSAFDPLMPVNRSTFQIAKEELETMIKDIHASELENDHTVMFIKNAIGCFIKRIEQQKNIVDGNLDTPDVSESQNFSARTYSQRNDVESGQVSSMDSCCEDIRLKAEYGREQISEIMKWHVQEYLLQSQKYQLGSVIPVHCGHNGWVGPAATESYIQYLAERGF